MVNQPLNSFWTVLLTQIEYSLGRWNIGADYFEFSTKYTNYLGEMNNIHMTSANVKRRKDFAYQFSIIDEIIHIWTEFCSI